MSHWKYASLAWLLLGAIAAAAENPCTNGSFEQLAPNKFPAGWAPVGIRVEVTGDAHSGQRALRLLRESDSTRRETGLNRGPTLTQLKGGMEFWYKAVAGAQSALVVQVIPMTARNVECTAARRATYEVPAHHIGDGQWHRGRVKYDYSGAAEVASVHFAARIIGADGELLLDDFAYVEQVGPVLKVRSLGLDEDAQRPGERAVLRVTVENAGDAPIDDLAAGVRLPAGLTCPSAASRLGPLKPDATKTVAWTIDGLRSMPGKIEWTLGTGADAVTAGVVLESKLEIRSFGPVSPVAIQGQPLAIECVLENVGTAVVLNPTARFDLPGGPVVHTVPRLAPGQTSVLSTPLVVGKDLPEARVAVSVSASGGQQGPTADSVLTVAPDTKLPSPFGRLNAVANKECAVLENEHVRLAFRRGKLVFPGELSVFDQKQWRTVAWLPQLTRIVYRRADAQPITLTLPPLPAAATSDAKQAVLTFQTAIEHPDGARWDLKAEFRLNSGAKRFDVEYQLQVDKAQELLAFDGPMLYVGRRDEAVFPGLEWLVGDELSSSTLDIAPGHPHQKRFVVHPNMVTIPAIGVHGAEGTVGLLWDLHQKWDGTRDRPSALFASPDRLSNQRSHVMGLFLPTVPDFVKPNEREARTPYPLAAGQPVRLTCQVWADGPKSDAIAPIEEWLRLYGWPGLPPLPRRSYEREIEFSMQAYLKSLWVPDEHTWWTTKGGGMMSPKGRPPAFVADLLLGEILAADPRTRRQCHARAEEVQKLLGGELRLDALRFPGRADLAMASPSHAASILAGRGPDGAWRFDADQEGRGPFVGMDYHRLGPDNALELGTCAQRAYHVLRYARIAGDREAYGQMRVTLELMEQFRVPRAAQVWEVPVHTPDLLAAADAIDAYVEAYRISGDPRWLKDALFWARRGLPFVYLWNDPDKPFLVGGSIPVFGATWFRGSWFGRPVQWNGLRYARALLKLDQYDQSHPWRKLAELQIRSAIYQQDNEGENVALWPDNIDAIDSKKCPWVFAPREIISNVLALLGRDEDPTTVMLGAGARRLHLSATAKISDARWEDRTLQFAVQYPPYEQGVVLVSNVARPRGVTVDGRPIQERSRVEQGAEPGWRYDAALAYLSIRIAGDKPTRVRVEGAEFRDVSRIPRLARSIAFEFTETPDGWICAHDLEDSEIRNGSLCARVSGADPYLIRPRLEVDGSSVSALRIRMRATAGGGGQLFWTTSDEPAFSEKRSVRFPLVADGAAREYRIDLGRNPHWQGHTITGLRLDPGGGASNGEVAIDYIRGEAK